MDHSVSRAPVTVRQPDHRASADLQERIQQALFAHNGVPRRLIAAALGVRYLRRTVLPIVMAGLLGFGAMAVSGRRLTTRAMRSAFVLADNEELLCFVGIGTAAKGRVAPPEPDQDLLQPWRPARIES